MKEEIDEVLLTFSTLWFCTLWLKRILINKTQYNEEKQKMEWLIGHCIRGKYLLFHTSHSQCLWMDNGVVISQ